MRNNFFSVLFFLSFFYVINGQTLLDKLEKQKQEETTFYTRSTFIGTRISIGHSVETRKKGSLEISARNRFWDLPTQTSSSFLADKMSTRFGVDYSITNTFTLGVGVSTLDGNFNGYLKYRLLQQQTNGPNKFGLTWVQTTSYRSKKTGMVELRDNFNDRLAYTSQLLIARRFSRRFSAQVTPTFIHRGSSRFSVDDPNHFALGMGVRFKTTIRSELVSEYFYVANPLNSIETFNAVSIGYNWALKNISLQFKLTNSGLFAEDAFITQTRKNLNTRRGNLFFGFTAIYFLQL